MTDLYRRLFPIRRLRARHEVLLAKIEEGEREL
jgi:hypothetical protein